MHDARPNYSDDEKKAALELAIAIGRREAVRQLNISPSAFQRWTQQFPQFWSDLKAGDPEQQRKGFAKSLEDLAAEGMSVEHEALWRAHDQLKTSDPKETAAILKAAAASRQTAIIGAKQVLGEPDVVEHNINFPAIEAAMERLLEGHEPPALQVANEAEDVDGPE